MNIFKRVKLHIPQIVSAILVFGFLMSCSAFSALATDIGEIKADFMQVSLDGMIRLSFKFASSKLDGITSFNAIVSGANESKRNAAFSVTYDEKDSVEITVVTVALMPYEMAEEVTIEHLAGSTVIAETTGSVLEYANKILNDKTVESKYHDAAKALLNYGAMAQTDHAAKNGYKAGILANEGLYSRESNPTDGICGVPFEDLANTTGKGDKIDKDKSSVSLEFGEGDIALRYTIYYNGENSSDLVAEFTTPGNEEIKGKLVSTGKANEYSFTIRNLGVMLFDYKWNVTISDGEGGNSITSEHSVLEYLNWNIATATLEDDEVSDSEKDVCRALYQLYKHTADKATLANCAHGNAGYWVKADENTSYLMCCFCNKQTNEAAIANSVNTYFPGSVLTGVDTDEPSNVKSSFHGDDGVLTWNSGNVGCALLLLCEPFWSTIKDSVPNGGGNGKWNLLNNKTYDSGEAMHESFDGKTKSYSFDIGEAQYMVVRFALSNDNSSGALKVSLGSDAVTFVEQEKANQSGVLSEVKLEHDGKGVMATYVISLSLFDKAGAEKEHRSRRIDSFRLGTGRLPKDTTITIDFIAFVENWEEVGAVAGEDASVAWLIDEKGTSEQKKVSDMIQ